MTGFDCVVFLALVVVDDRSLPDNRPKLEERLGYRPFPNTEEQRFTLFLQAP
jgi:hypothetical protein